MKYFIFRNQTIEPFFDSAECSFSGYEDISSVEEADRYVWFYLPNYKTDEAILAQEIDTYSNLLEMTIAKLSKSKLLLVFTMHINYRVDYVTSSHLLDDAVILYNQHLYKLAAENSNLKVIDIAMFFRSMDVSQAIDWRFYYISQMALNPKLAPVFRRWFDRQIDAIELKRKKCIVLDLDNTLWGGVLGEDGVNGISLGETYPGSAYRDFQQFLLDLSKKGILLTACSKNNETDVLEAWDKNPNMILRKEHFATYRINWNNKGDNIREIAEELNIGLDSLVFVDDNPTERELVKQMLPMVEVPDFPKQPYMYPVFGQMLVDNYFRIYELTKEDLDKTQQYRDNAVRTQFKLNFTDYSDYLKSLEIELTVERMSDANIIRFAQMTQKTNQFNLTTRRYTETDLTAMSEVGYLLYGLRVKDRFGDNGMTGLIIIKNDGKHASIDSLLLSCRILGKDIETEFVNYILNKLKNRGVIEVEANYLKTAKNSQVAEFYDKMGFVLMYEANNEKRYNINLGNFIYTGSMTYKINEL